MCELRGLPIVTWALLLMSFGDISTDLSRTPEFDWRFGSEAECLAAAEALQGRLQELARKGTGVILQCVELGPDTTVSSLQQCGPVEIAPAG